MIIKGIELSDLLEIPKVKAVFSRSRLWHAVKERGFEWDFALALEQLFEYSGEGIDFEEFLSGIEYNWDSQWASEIMGIWDDEELEPLDEYYYNCESKSFVKVEN
jgi:hypothetical protein